MQSLVQKAGEATDTLRSIHVIQGILVDDDVLSNNLVQNIVKLFTNSHR